METGVEEVDFSKVNWNKLEPKEFHLLEQKLKSRIKSNKKTTRKNSGKKIMVTVEGKNYYIPESFVLEIKQADAEKRKLLIEDVKKQFEPIMEL